MHFVPLHTRMYRQDHAPVNKIQPRAGKDNAIFFFTAWTSPGYVLSYCKG